MTKISDVIQVRVRYSETDQMGTFYNSRALDWVVGLLSRAAAAPIGQPSQ